MFLPAFFVIALLIQLHLSFSFTNITSFYYPSFLPGNTVDIVFSGNATVTSDGVLELTRYRASEEEHDVGRAIYAKPVRLYDPVTGSAADFISHFTFVINQFNETSYYYRGDGLTFFLAKVDSELPENSHYQYLGLFNASNNGLSTNQVVAVEFDTYYNYLLSSEPMGNHMGIDVNTVNSATAVRWEFDSVRSLNGEAWVWYNSSVQTLFARLTNRNLQPDTEWTISLPIDLSKVLPENIVVGFTGAAISYERHHILSWNFTSTITTPDPQNHTTDPIDTKPAKKITSHPQSQRLVLILVQCGVVVFLIGFAVITTVALMRRARKTDADERMDKGMQNGACSKEDHDAIRTKEIVSDPGKKDQNLVVHGVRVDGHVCEEDDRVKTNLDTNNWPRKFSYTELWAATNGFSPEGKLGKGGSGWVYRGVLTDHGQRTVAVKCLSANSSQAKKLYISELTAISQLRHPNLVRLLGWCNEGRERLLVYEYMEKGSLDTYLFEFKNQQVLPWSQRMRIALDVASAVFYLHEEWVQCVLHRDIKSSNVMIDSMFRARLGDFGLARLVDHDDDDGVPQQTTTVAGTAGYIAPEFFYGGHISKEGDVYSLGVLLLEIACGRRALLPVGNRPETPSLVEWVWGFYVMDALLEAVDRSLGLQFNEEEAVCMIMVGLWCALPDPASRPTIRDAMLTLGFQQGLPALPKTMPRLTLQIPTVIESNSF